MCVCVCVMGPCFYALLELSKKIAAPFGVAKERRDKERGTVRKRERKGRHVPLPL